MRARVVWTIVAACALLAFASAPVHAEGYNQGMNISPTRPAPRVGWGGVSTDQRMNKTGVWQYSVFEGAQFAPKGPHGDYTTTTNKCQDCHSTHYAVGSYMLLRSNSREGACDFCHGGGGGSTRSIMMDNAYTATPAEVLAGGESADSTTTSGFGTGHTLGYTGRAPADIRPAYQQTQGFACFDCHTPHGNSERVLTTFSDPGRHVGLGEVSEVVRLWWAEGDYEPSLAVVSTVPVSAIENIALKQPGSPEDGRPFDGWWYMYGIDKTTGNIVAKYDLSEIGDGAGVDKRPVFPTGKFLLLKNPDNENDAGLEGDLATSTTVVDGKQVVTNGSNKISIDWNKPLGTATVSSSQNIHAAGNNERYAYPPYYNGLGVERPGLATESEYCTDCHDGVAGLSTQAAEVWYEPNADYITAYSHDAQPRGCARQMFLNPGDENNYGPNCRNCHTGAGSCQQCHVDPATQNEYGAEEFTDPAYYQDLTAVVPLVEGQTTYVPPSYFKMINQKWVYAADLDSACLDGGFSFPHRTLGVNMLKDALWGVDFDGTPIAPGEVRAAGETTESLAAEHGAGSEAENFYLRTSWAAAGLIDKPAQNLDSACIDCHGDAKAWNGDDPSYYTSQTVNNDFYGYAPDQVPYWEIRGWDLLLKGLP